MLHTWTSTIEVRRSGSCHQLSSGLGGASLKTITTNWEASVATLLVIDDDSVVRELLRQFFSEEYECDTADRAEQALQYLEFKEYDAIITDAFMPAIGGLQILKRIQQRHLPTPVIVISGKGDRF